MMTFDHESQFENALIELLQNRGWESEVLKNPTEQDLLKNWANILFENNRCTDRLNNVPLTDSEMQQIIEQINTLKTPLKLNSFINGKTVSITRDNPDDSLHLGKEVSLKIYDRHEIAAGQSRYQIVQQPDFPTKNPILKDRRGDVMLLINGMPVFHLELKKSGVSVNKACYQIEKYANAGIFTGLFSLVQIFVAMTPEETVYFANPDGKFQPEYYFHWADFNNVPMNDYKDIATSLLSIPMAHQLIGFYTVADTGDGVLKVMRSYQYYAANAISDKVARADWFNTSHKPKGGYIWHTTGSGKTMTSFKSAQLIANSKDADKVVFLMDRIELGTQSFIEYEGFSEKDDSVQKTADTRALLGKLKSNNVSDTLIVSSIQKMSNIKEEYGMNSHDIDHIKSKRLVFIVDEAHRSTFGDMLRDIKRTFPQALFFGFTGTPILDENKKKRSTTSDIFGDELHRYTLVDGISDKNVLGFDPYRVSTFKDKDIRQQVALHKAKASSEAEIWGNLQKEKVYQKYMDSKVVPMAGYYDAKGKYQKGIEDEIPNNQYDNDVHRNMVVSDIVDNFMTLSRGKKFHAIFATSSIMEAIAYYRLFKQADNTLKISALFDPNEGNEKTSTEKEQGLAEIIEDYNQLYEQSFTISTHAKFKKDIANRLAHKETYKRIELESEKQLDLLIVVDQMLTGFDSKWVNTLYLDKVIVYQNIIQAFSRTNRLFGHEKPFGTIRYYRKPHMMERNVNEAIRVYSGDRPTGLFVDNLPKNITHLNQLFIEITDVFKGDNIDNFETAPKGIASQGEFAKLFTHFNEYLEAAEIQGFVWDKLDYTFDDEDNETIIVLCDEQTYLVLALRYKELFAKGSHEGSGSSNDDVPFDLTGHLIDIDTGRIDADYLNERYKKYLKALNLGDFEEARDQLHKSFSSLTQEEQKFATIFLHDIQSGDITPDPDKTFKDYIVEYQQREQDSNIHDFAEALGLDEGLLRKLMMLGLTEKNINEFGRLDELKDTVDKAKAKSYLEEKKNASVPMRKVTVRVDALLREFILEKNN